MPVAVEQQEQREIAALVETLLNGNTYGRLQAAEALGEIGEPSVRPLVRALIARNTHARWNIAMALARVGTPAVEPLITVVNTQDDAVRSPAVWALAEIGDTRAVEAMIAAMKNGRSECCRALSAAALLKLGHPAGVAAVEKELLSAHQTFQELVFEALEGT